MWEARDKLQQPDVIMNPNVQSYIEKFIAHNGNQSAYGSILKKMGFNVLGDFESFITRKLIQSFTPSIVDTLCHTICRTDRDVP